MDLQNTISVIIPAYNCQEYISDAIDSVLSQTRAPDEIIIVDDGSSDNTKEIVLGIEKIRYISQYHGGVSAARNTGIRLSASRWIAFLDSDDLWLPEHLENVMNVIKKYDLEWACGERIEVKYEKNILPKAFLEHKIALTEGELINNYFPTKIKPFLNVSGAVISKKALEDVGCFDETFHNGEDTDLFYRLGYRYRKVGWVEASVIHRLRTDSLSKRKNSAPFNILKKHHDLITGSKDEDLTFALCLLTRSTMYYFFDKGDKISLKKALKDYGHLLDDQRIQKFYMLATYSMWLAHILLKVSKMKKNLLRLINKGRSTI